MLSVIGGRVLGEGGVLREAGVTIDAGHISAIGNEDAAGKSVLDASGYLVLPAIIDLHGDAFERQIMPRPGVHFPLDLALQETDRQMISNGIATAYHGITYSWEPGLRGRETALELLNALAALQDRLACDTRVHLRWETFNTPAAGEIAGWIEEGRIDLLAFNNHLEMMQRELDNAQKLVKYAGRAGISGADFIKLVHDVAARADQVEGAKALLAACAVDHGIPCASHDDETAEMRAGYHQLGVGICEFPVNEETARYAIDHGDPVVLGGPNILRGGSHCARLNAAESAKAGLCSILTSDYYYPSLLQAPFRLVNDGIVDFQTAWNMVSRNPAQAAGLTDRGEVREGLRADLVIIDDSDPACPRVMATIVRGRPVYMFDADYRICA
ncbi:alpha-D-ribose 1-methylphosphonate 5-triphosphate diphosphatase [Aestuariispira insulae]|uniref:Alpha-D-ribose 1-methylphosphonate 5-triphosphate diphosphatase n=1 Tax=Aestuariispira insulae TaxID=1461337 RepID=A0A3D9H6V3_9PROT|nr:alpha-D-ribose 1-methylphosphonate 5-triphosphate diphosphatase [Aestuariispira insulae]RED44881.1 alpha-D-ribose 1-methylphosphonate 5-triphosphate diphosphatase [Aestuariispira insulae]